MPFMPYLIRAQSVYRDKDMLISSHTHIHACTLQIHVLLAMGW